MFQSFLSLEQTLPILHKRQIPIDLHQLSENQRISEFRRIMGNSPRFHINTYISSVEIPNISPRTLSVTEVAFCWGKGKITLVIRISKMFPFLVFVH